MRGCRIPCTLGPLVAESNDPAYLTRFDRYRAEYKQYTSNILKASGTIFGLLDGNLKRKYGDEKWSADPAGLWNEIKTERERVLKIDGKHLMQKLVNIKFSEFDTSAEYYTVVKDTAARVGTCGIPQRPSDCIFHAQRSPGNRRMDEF